MPTITSKRGNVHQEGFDSTWMSAGECSNKSNGATLPSSTGFPPWATYTPVNASRLPMGGNGDAGFFKFARAINLQDPAWTSSAWLVDVTRELTSHPSI